MLNFRISLLTATGLLTTLAATAQTTTPAGPQPVDVLSWITWGAAAIVLLMAVITGASVTGAAQRRYTETPAAPSLTAETMAARPAQPQVAEALAA